MSYLYGDLNHKMVSKEYTGIDNETAKTIVNNENNTIEVLVDQRPIKEVYNKLKIALKFKADLEQPKYGESTQLVVPYRELPPIIYLRDTLPEQTDEAQPGVLYILKGENNVEYTAYIWDVGAYDEETQTYGKYVELFTINYPDLKNRPSINGHLLDGIDYEDSDLGLQYQITEDRKLPSTLVEFEEGKTIKEALEEEKRERVNGDDILQDHLDAEILARINADLNTLEKLAAEQQARENADADLQQQLIEEAQKRKDIDDDLQNQIVVESTKRKEIDTDLQNQINTETSSRKAMDTNLQEQIVVESQKRKQIDDDLQSQIDAEATKRSAKDEDLQSQIIVETSSRKVVDADLQTQITNESTKRSAKDEDLQAQITAETQKRSAKDEDLQTQIVTESQKRKAIDDDLQAQIATETSERKSADTTLTTNLTTEISNRENADNILQQNITAEATARAQEDANLDDRLNVEKTERIQKDADLQTQLTTEIGIRTSSDEALDTKINTEASTRNTNDETLQTNINNESTIRATSDNNLQTQIDNLTNDKINKSEKGTANGVATLGDDGKVPSSQLPAYVDDVVEYASLSEFPLEGESGKIYVALDTNKTYRWGGTTYVEISASLALGETSSTAYAGDKGKANREDLNSHIANTNNPHTVTKEQIGLGNVDNTSDANKPISSAVQTALDNKQDTIPANTYDAYGSASTVQSNLDNHTSNTIVHITADERSAWNAKYDKPATGISKSDLSSDVQTSLSKADTAIQSHQSLDAYRTSADQDVIDASKQDKLTAGNGVNITSNEISIKLGEGLKFVDGKITLDIESANGKKFGGNQFGFTI